MGARWQRGSPIIFTRRLFVGVSLASALAIACGGQTTQTPVETAPNAANAIRCGDYVACEFACREGRSDSCTELARMFESGEGAPQNIKRAAELYEQACRMSNRDACAHLALMYDVGLGVGHDPSSAAYWYESACALGHSWSCSRKESLQTPRN
jgi:TPR repeat protein